MNKKLKRKTSPIIIFKYYFFTEFVKFTITFYFPLVFTRIIIVTVYRIINALQLCIFYIGNPQIFSLNESVKSQ